MLGCIIKKQQRQLNLIIYVGHWGIKGYKGKGKGKGKGEAPIGGPTCGQAVKVEAVAIYVNFDELITLHISLLTSRPILCLAIHSWRYGIMVWLMAWHNIEQVPAEFPYLLVRPGLFFLWISHVCTFSIGNGRKKIQNKTRARVSVKFSAKKNRKTVVKMWYMGNNIIQYSLSSGLPARFRQRIELPQVLVLPPVSNARNVAGIDGQSQGEELQLQHRYCIPNSNSNHQTEELCHTSKGLIDLTLT